MRIITVLSTLIFGLSVPAALHGQAAKSKDSFVSHTEVALDFNYERGALSPAPTFQNSHYSMAGVSATGAYAWRWHTSLVVDFSGVHVNGISNTGQSLTLLTSTVGVRYKLPVKKDFSPFVQVLAGEAHATGGVYQPNAFSSGQADSFALNAGGGIDHPLNHVVSARVGAAYVYTALPNTTNNRQSFFRADGGLVIHFGAR